MITIQDLQAEAAGRESDATNHRSTELLDSWLKRVATNNIGVFAQRLALDGLTLETAPLLFDIEQPLLPYPPSWLDTFQGCIALMRLETLEESHRFINVDQVFPFEEFFIPFVLYGRTRLDEVLGGLSSFPILSEGSLAGLERWLLTDLTGTAAFALGQHFALYRTAHVSSLNLLIRRTKGSSHNRIYNNFIRHLFTTGAVPFFLEYSVLAKMLSILVEQWVVHISEFILRLRADWGDLESAFGPASSFDSVRSVQLGLSDRHDDGRTVIIVTFDEGTRVVYKPRYLGPEQGFNKLLHWINNHASLPLLKVLRFVSRERYGWMEFVEYLPCQHRADVQHFYRRAGVLLCVAYLLNSRDLHQENMVAHGGDPVLVDLETILHPLHPVEEAKPLTSADSIAEREVVASVFNTGFLPRWTVANNGGDVFDVSGLGGVYEQVSRQLYPGWKNLNSDEMHIKYESQPLSSQKNVVLLKEEPVYPEDFLDDLAEGFKATYRFLQENKQLLLRECAPLTTMFDHEFRFILRNTSEYASLLRSGCFPEMLREGITRGIHYDSLARYYLRQETPSVYWPILHDECRNLISGNVPRFTISANSTDLILSDGASVKELVKQSAKDLICQRLDKLNESDLEKQIRYLKAAFVSRGVVDTISDHIPVGSSAKQGPLPPPFRLHTSFLQEARNTFEELERTAIQAQDGSATWIGLEPVGRDNRYVYRPVGCSLYGGLAGIALFLSGYYAVERCDEAKKLALATFRTVDSYIEALKRKEGEGLPLGIGTGVTSIVYAIVRSSRLLEDDRLLDLAHDAFSLVTEERIMGDNLLDVLSGSAGAIIASLIYAESCPNEEILATAIRCGDHLLDRRVWMSEHGYHTWQTVADRPLAGHSHGAAGIALALLKLFAATGHQRYRDAALEAVAYEDTLFSEEDLNWPDLRGDVREDHLIYQPSWCHGAPGIGMARLGALPITDDSAVRQDFDAALAFTQQYGVQTGPDHLCCGNLGRIDFLLEAGSHLEEDEYVRQAQTMGWHVLCNRQERGSFNLIFDTASGIHNPGLFQGISGVGYELLRLAHHEKLPSILLWQ